LYSVYQHWDKLKTCVVGQSYPPEFYSYITNPRVRNVMERIAIETEEDYQKLITLLKSFDVKILRPELKDSIEFYKIENKKYSPPPMNPRDDSGMFGNTFYINNHFDFYTNIIKDIQNTNTVIQGKNINTASITRIGKDLYFGTPSEKDLYKFIEPKFAHKEKFLKQKEKILKQHMVKQTENFPSYRCHVVKSEGHIDGCFCPVVPGLIVSLYNVQTYSKSFPKWEVIYLPNQSFNVIESFRKLKNKNNGKWWIPGEELNDDLTDFIESWLNHWVGYVEETVFDVNMLVIDKKNVVCNNYNKTVFDAFDRHGITPHVINFRHRYFWDGGLHCITSDLDRDGVMEDYFPERL